VAAGEIPPVPSSSRLEERHDNLGIYLNLELEAGPSDEATWRQRGLRIAASIAKASFFPHEYCRFVRR